MKKIFLLICLVFIFENIDLFSNEKMVRDISFSSGIMFDEKYLDARVFTKIEKKDSEELNFNLSSWGIKLTPFDCVSIFCGDVMLSGLWSRFNNPAPSSFSSLKEPFLLQKKLLVSLPSIDSTSSNFCTNLSLGFAHLQIDAYTKGLDLESLSTGIGVSFKFETSDSKFKTHCTSAWQVVPISSKKEDSWFINKQYFKCQHSNSFIQEIGINSYFNALIISFGITEQPFENLGWFVRTEYSLDMQPFLLNMQVFFSNNNYMTHNSSIILTPFIVAANPQLRFYFDNCYVTSIYLGFAFNAEVKKNEKYFLPMEWLFDCSTSIKLVTKHSKVEFLARYAQHVLDVSTELNFEPSYGFKRIWKMDCCYEKEIEEKFDKGKLFIVSGISMKNVFAAKHIFENTLLVESVVDLNILNDNRFCFGFDSALELQGVFFDKNQSLKLNGHTKITFQQKKPAKFEADFSFIIAL